jgi:hypothetical protein
MATDWTTGWSRFDSRQRQDKFSLNTVTSSILKGSDDGVLYLIKPRFWTLPIVSGYKNTMFRELALWPTQPPVHWIPGVKRGRGVMLITHPFYCLRREWVGAIHHLPSASPWVCCGTALPLTFVKRIKSDLPNCSRWHDRNHYLSQKFVPPICF